jgi:hypothetical protein
MKYSTPLFACALLLLSNAAVSQFIFKDKDGKQVSADEFFATHGSRNKVIDHTSGAPGSSRCTSKTPKSPERSAENSAPANDDNNDRRNFHDRSGKRISKQQFKVLFPNAVIDPIGNDDRANVYPPKE